MAAAKNQQVLEEILDGNQIQQILKQTVGDLHLTYKGSKVKIAVDGLAGFLGEHIKAVLYVEVEGKIREVNLFIKKLPTNNKPKMDFIVNNNYFNREKLMYQLLQDIACEDSLDSWYAKAFIYTDSLIVMPDLTCKGYLTRHNLHTLDPEHIFVTTKSLARLHAAFINYETKKSIALSRTYNTLEEFGSILSEPTYCEGPWLKAAAKLSTNIIKTFSTKPYRDWQDLESKLTKLLLKACDSLTEYKETVNVLLHKDLWVNNIMFKYEHDRPINAILLDYQCTRYGPPAFDIMIFLYLCTDRCFREEREKDVFNLYYSIFTQELTKDSLKRLLDLGYDKEDFLKWCETGRMFGMFEAIGIFPYILMDPKTAQKAFDDPAMFDKISNEDRTEPVLAHAHVSETYRLRNLQINEEFFERYSEV